MRLPADLPDLPIRDALDDVVTTLQTHGRAVLVAPPGTGKTTLVPLALAAATRGKVLVAEPRRLAARAAAARMAALLGEPVGGTVGYAVRGDRRTSDRTRIEVVTSGLLVRRLQADPELSGVDTVLLDECHERHLDADLLLAMLLDVRAGLRPELRLLAASATVAGRRLADLLDEAPLVTVDARTHPVDVVYAPPSRGERIESCVVRTTRTALSQVDGDVGDVLVFLPGAAEIGRVADGLAGLAEVDVRTLHGRLGSAQQDAVLAGAAGVRRVVLATAVAESSLTVPGVRAVVDSGLARVPRTDHRRGLSGLATVRVSAAVADQRAGRAGREAPGRVYRCWPEHEHATLPRYPEPEIRTADLTRFALELACWGTPDGVGLRWWDAPPEGALRSGRAVLTALGALDGGELTGRGRRMAGLGLHPRLARALLDGAEQVGADRAAEVVALLDDDALADGIEVEAALRRLRSSNGGRWRREARRLAALVPDRGRNTADDPALVVALAHPERLARRRSPGSPVYLMAGGTAVELPGGSALADQEWLAVAVADRQPGSAHGKVRLAARADEDLAVRCAEPLLSTADEVGWRDGDVVARRVRRLGAIVLAESPLPDPPQEAIRAALLDGLRATNLRLLSWDDRARSLRDRIALLRRTLGADWPAVDDEALLSTADSWLGGARTAADLGRIDVAAALRSLLPWREAARLDELAPRRLEVPSGSRILLDYSGERPVLAVRLQEVFGWTDTPTIADGRIRVVLHLLSPAGRPAAVTDDLKSFWAGGYHQVRAELRGRYPKHAWPADPLTATPTKRPSKVR